MATSELIHESRQWLSQQRAQRSKDEAQNEQTATEAAPQESPEVAQLRRRVAEEKERKEEFEKQLKAATAAKTAAEQAETETAYDAKSGDSTAKKALIAAERNYNSATSEKRHLMAALEECQSRIAGLLEDLTQAERRAAEARLKELMDQVGATLGRIEKTEQNLVDEFGVLSNLSAEANKILRALGDTRDFHHVAFRAVRFNLNFQLRPFYPLGQMPADPAFRRRLSEIASEIIKGWKPKSGDEEEVA